MRNSLPTGLVVANDWGNSLAMKQGVGQAPWGEYQQEAGHRGDHNETPANGSWGDLNLADAVPCHAMPCHAICSNFGECRIRFSDLGVALPSAMECHDLSKSLLKQCLKDRVSSWSDRFFMEIELDKFDKYDKSP